jgi:hypothetical protein
MIEKYCLLCGSKNYIPDHEDADAYQCWNCFSNFWLDDYAKTIYMITNGVDEDQAEFDLKNGNLFMLNGQCENGQNV